MTGMNLIHYRPNRRIAWTAAFATLTYCFTCKRTSNCCKCGGGGGSGSFKCCFGHDFTDRNQYRGEISLYVIIQNRIIFAECIEVLATFFLDGVAVEPAAEDGRIDALLIADHADHTVVVLRAEAEGEHVGEGTGRFDDVAVGIIGVLRGALWS